MATSTFTPFQRHLTFFAVQPDRTRITFYSAFRAALTLGLNVPFSIVLALTMRFYWAQNPFRPVNISSIPRSAGPTHLQHTQLTQSKYTPDELVKIYEDSSFRSVSWWQRTVLDRPHIQSFANWSKGADGMVSRDQVEEFQTGSWQQRVVIKRREKKNPVPFIYGGPLLVGPHSWAVKHLFGVHVYDNLTHLKDIINPAPDPPHNLSTAIEHPPEAYGAVIPGIRRIDEDAALLLGHRAD
ncbi:uncharacterized protein I206_106297 [Kwoniella pini CBS 10737]|uniref:Uncharacterized protein n=1 Tax=Kwoniella pini CBS 10737 TaxID=1296096 RepID=A0A1B9HTW5_9TREE|nr:uncharacterized protein I206_07099 [Kwoniella pini CBS 10737]OCF46712.1 hypothetical protein I206_07099 [Kwoniella pini CBS 10737]